MPKVKKSSKKIKKVPEGRGIIKGRFSFNNTKFDLVKENGDILTWVSAGSVDLGGTKKVTGTRKGTQTMAEKTAEEIIRRAAAFGIHNVKIEARGIGAGRDPALKRILREKSLNTEEIIDKTPLPHGGCRPRKRPRK